LLILFIYFPALQNRQLSAAQAAQRHAARLRAAASSVGTSSEVDSASFINSDEDFDDDDDDASKFSATTETTEQSSKYGRQRQRRRRHHMPFISRVRHPVVLISCIFLIVFIVRRSSASLSLVLLYALDHSADAVCLHRMPSFS